MHKLEELKDMLCEELEEYGSKDKLDMGSLEIVDKLAHAIKNIDKIIEMSDEYSERYDGGSYRYGGRSRDGRIRGMNRSYRNEYGGSMRRSRGGDMVAELHELKADAPNEMIAREFDNLIRKIEQM